MKARLAMLIAFSTIFLIDQSNAGCNNDDWANQYGYQRTQSSECACTDTGWKYNECMSKAAYCHAFGNIGATGDFFN